MDNYENMSPGIGRSRATQGCFTATVILAQLVGIAAIVITGVWLSKYRGGFAWQDDPSREFNYHPLFMVIGMIFLYGNAMLVYRVFINDRKRNIKILHACLLILALACAAFALKAVFDSHNLAKPSIPNLYSIHSWMGIITVSLFGLQWLFGLTTFLVPGLSDNIKSLYKPIHVFWGIAIFVMAIATALMGINEKLLFLNTKDYNYADLHAEHVLVNTLGLVLVLLGFIVVYLVTNGNYKREPRPEEEHLVMSHDSKTSSAD